MIFRKYHSFHSNKKPEELLKYIAGQHLQVHGLDFEIYPREDGHMLKIIPHAENDEDFRTIPITHLTFKPSSSGGCKVSMMSKPRKIDAGGPTILVVFLVLAFCGGLAIYIGQVQEYMMAGYGLMGIALVIFLIFWYRLQRGYYDYIRKIKSWVKGHI
jgi:hypothetical protein